MRLLPATLLLALMVPAGAQELGDFGHGHAEWHHWYHSADDGGPLKRPYDTRTNCCDVDCRPTKARHDGSQWWVWVDRAWEPVPEDRIKRTTLSGKPVKTPNGMAHVCASRRSPHLEPVIYCFIEPESDG
jgi:hypothetical protein